MCLALSGEHVDHIWGLGWLWGTHAFFRQTRLLIRRFPLVEHDDFISRFSMKQNVFQVSSSISSSILVVSPQFVTCLIPFQPRWINLWNDMDLMCRSSWSAFCDARYLVDPFIHQWRGYDDPANLQDNEHQMVFEDNMDSEQQCIVTIAAIRYNWNNYTRHNF